MPVSRKLAAEFIGTFGLVLGGCGSALLAGISVTDTSVNPARSTGPALTVGDWALGQPWLFRVAPILGALIAGHVCRRLGDHQ